MFQFEMLIQTLNQSVWEVPHHKLSDGKVMLAMSTGCRFLVIDACPVTTVSCAFFISTVLVAIEVGA